LTCGSYEFIKGRFPEFYERPYIPTFHEAKRDVGKWLNEQPNRPIDKQCLAVLLAGISSLEQEIDMYEADEERIWALMPELRNIDAQYELHEAVAEKVKARDTVWVARFENMQFVCDSMKTALSMQSSAAIGITVSEATVFTKGK
jgi:hypothetical protein